MHDCLVGVAYETVSDVVRRDENGVDGDERPFGGRTAAFHNIVRSSIQY